ncbi:MAG: ferrous iron transport protein A [Arcobacteraceae bacterium]|jgi:Fe2+ transport system protein FeoA|nr:ferrous iron transport protein A [Arcobacteraceae bacterium]
MSLNDLKEGNSCVIKKIGGDKKIVQKFLDMGFVPNSNLCVVRNAPLYDPIEVNIKGYDIAIRRSEASNIQVELI